MQLRRYQPGDLAAILSLFRDTVHRIAAADYSPAQLDAWAPAQPDEAAWALSLRHNLALVAVEGGELVGFGDIDLAAGYLDRLYVHSGRQRRGIATALCGALEASCGAPRLTTHASLTARPFFERQGWRVVNRQTVVRRGVELDNFVMEKLRRGL